MNFYTSDTHAFHRFMIKACNRPFADVQEMTQALANNINSKVGENDWLYHLGDWAFGQKYEHGSQLRNAIAFREMIQCRNVVLIFGNHDYRLRDREQFKQLFRRTADILEVNDETVNQKIFLSHYAMRVWNASHHGRWALYGHSHGRLPDNDTFSFDVGVDAHNYLPISSLEVQKIMQDKWDRGVRPPLHHHRDAAR